MIGDTENPLTEVALALSMAFGPCFPKPKANVEGVPQTPLFGWAHGMASRLGKPCPDSGIRERVHGRRN